MIAQKTRYALRSLLFLAEEAGGGPVQLSRIAETQRVPCIASPPGMKRSTTPRSSTVNRFATDFGVVPPLKFKWGYQI